MSVIDKQASSLILAIQESKEYREYRKQEAILAKNPELKARVNLFRKENFESQAEAQVDTWESVMEQLAWEEDELRRIPQISAYLDAELALCRLVQRTVSKITAGIAIDTPF